MPAFKENNDGPRAIHITESERARGQYSAANLQAALEGLHQDGLLLLKSVVDVAHIDHLNHVMKAETQEILNGQKGRRYFNHKVQSNILQCPAVEREEDLFEDVWFNPFIVQIANAYLGAKPIMNFTTANNALKRTGGLRQPVHKDINFPNHPQVSRIWICTTGSKLTLRAVPIFLHCQLPTY